LNYTDLSVRIILKKINKAVEIDYCLYQKLHKIRTEKYGEQTEAEVSYSTRPNKAILVAGTNIQELKNVLESVKDKNIDVYTHGEMITAYTYPVFREYPHLRGQFGKGIEHCLLDFATFPGAILIAKHSLENIEYLYRGRLFTTDNFVPQGVIKIQNNDYTPLIESALSAKGFKHGKTRESVIIGCNNSDFDEKMNYLTVKMSLFNNIIIIGTEEPTIEQRQYFDNLLKFAGDKTAVISLSENHNVKNFINIKSAPDFYMIYRIFNRIKSAAEENGVCINLFLSKCNKHTVSNILNLRRMGLENIYLSKCTPIMLNPALTKTLNDIYGIKPTTSAPEDAKMLCNE